MKQFKITTTRAILLATGLICLGLTGPVFAQQESASLSELIRQARSAGIEQSALDELQSRADRRGISQQQLMEIIEPALSMAEQNLPADHAIQKALEGLSKGVPAPRIASVITRIQSSTEQAGQVVDPWMSRADLQALGNSGEASAPREEFRNAMIKASSKAILQDIPAEAIRQILTEIGDRSVIGRTTAANIVAAIGILPDLPANGQPQVARSLVVRALQGGFSSGEIQNLPTALNMAQMRSQLPAASILEGVANQMHEGIPAAQILQNLYNGNIGGGPPGTVPKGPDNNPGQGRGQGSGQG